MLRTRFSPRRYHRYLESIDKEIARSERSGFTLSDDLRYLTDIDAVHMVGAIECIGQIRIEVEERLRLRRGSPWFRSDKNALVELGFYRYNAVLLNRGTIFRYNSPHANHRTFHHVHRYDVLGSGAEEVTELRERDVPSLRQVLQEAEAWYWEHLGGRAPSS